LDQKKWTVLSCPVKGLEFDEKTLSMIDTDADGKIRVGEIVAAAEWLTSVLKDKDAILKGEDTIPLAQINTECEAGKKLFDSARQILANLGLEKDSISVADTSDSVAIFAKTKLNGDGIVTPASTDDEDLKKTIETIVSTVGSQTDRSGEPGVDAELVEKTIRVIEENMSNIDFSVVQLGKEVGLTRGHLYKKLMAITGKSPLELIRIIRLKRGHSLLEQGKSNISEVAADVGFSAKQFSKYFKEEYGCLPSEFLRKN
jgi:AraC-like DNA-binding protein